MPPFPSNWFLILYQFYLLILAFEEHPSAILSVKMSSKGLNYLETF